MRSTGRSGRPEGLSPIRGRLSFCLVFLSLFPFTSFLKRCWPALFCFDLSSSNSSNSLHFWQREWRAPPALRDAAARHPVRPFVDLLQTRSHSFFVHRAHTLLSQLFSAPFASARNLQSQQQRERAA